MKTDMEAKQGVLLLITCELFFFFKYIFINFNSLNVFVNVCQMCENYVTFRLYIYSINFNEKNTFGLS